MKLVGKIVLGVVILSILVVAVTFIWIDRIAKAGVETGGTYALGTKTTLGDMDIGMLSGNVTMDDLTVANPSGFDTSHFLQLGKGRVEVSLGSLMEDKVVVPELVLSGVSMNLERKGTKGNYQVILDNLKKLESKDSGKAKEPPPTESKPGKRFVINHVLIDGVNVQVDLLPIGGKLSRVPLTIPRIELKDVGSDSDSGVMLSQLAGILTQAILTAVVQKGGNLIPSDIAGELTAGLDQIKGLGGSAIQVVGDVTTMVNGQAQKITEMGQGVIKGAGESAKAATQSLGGATKGLGEATKGIDSAGQELKKGIGNLLGPAKKSEK